MASVPTFTSFARSAVATSGTPFGFTADAVYIAATITTNALTLTRPDGTTIAVGLAPIGAIIPISCTAATFSGGPAGAVIALQAQ